MKNAVFNTAAPEDEDTRARLKAAEGLRDEDINLSDPDAPEVTDWTGAVRDLMHQHVEPQKTVGIDEDVLTCFRSSGPGYQMRINRVLRAAMIRDMRRHHALQGSE